MISMTTSPNGIRLTRDGTSYTAIGPLSLAALIRQLATPAPAPSPAPAPAIVAPLGQRLARARAKHLKDV